MRTKMSMLGLIAGLAFLGITGLSLALGPDVTLEEASVTFSDVYEIHRAPSGGLVISDYGQRAVWVVDPGSDDYSTADVGTVTDAQADPSGDLWWASGMSSFSTLPSGDTSMTTWSVGMDRQLYGVAFDEEGHVWLSEWFGTGSKLYRFTPPSLGTTQLCTYTLPAGTWSYYLRYEAGDLWLLNWWDDSIARFTPATRAVTRWDVGEISAERQGFALDGEGHLWWADRPYARLSRLDPGTDERTSYALPLGTTPQMVEVRDGLVWYTEGDSGTVGVLDPATATKSTETLSALSSTAPAPVCSEWGAGSSAAVSFGAGTLDWITSTVSPAIDSGGWTVYEFPAGAQPFGLSSAGPYHWVTDAGRQKLLRFAPSQQGVLSLTVSPSAATAFHGDLVTYTYTATYASSDNSAANTVQIADDTCSPVVFDGGDENGNDELDVEETWHFSCEYTIPPHTDDEVDPIVNTATLTGKQADGQPAIADEGSGVVDLVHHEGTLSLSLTPSATMVLPGQILTYTYDLQYASDDGAPAQNLSITDDVCAPVIGPDPGGDTNGNNYLDLGETWTFSCYYAVPDPVAEGTGSIVNVATAEGEDMDGDALEPVQDTATVAVGPGEEEYTVYLPLVTRR